MALYTPIYHWLETPTRTSPLDPIRGSGVLLTPGLPHLARKYCSGHMLIVDSSILSSGTAPVSHAVSVQQVQLRVSVDLCFTVFYYYHKGSVLYGNR